jgi:hypothetical protein
MTTIKKIITHGGTAHTDELRACAIVLYLAGYDIPIERRDPTEEELADPDVWVIDVGREHVAALHNFDHHQWTCDKEHGDPRCALSLVLEYFGYRDLWTSLYGWLPITEIMDVHGPVQAAKALGMSVENFYKTSSPVEKAVLKWFERIEDCNQESCNEVGDQVVFKEGLFDLLHRIGEDLVEYPNAYAHRLTWLQDNARLLKVPGQEYHYVLVPRESFLQAGLDNPKMALDQFCKETGKDIPVSVTPDSRGPGYGLFRFRDDKRVDFCRLKDHPHADFVHKGGFYATTSVWKQSSLCRLVAAGCDS